jgi:hypothetical protein
MTSEGDRVPGEIGCGTMLFRALVVADLLALVTGWIIFSQPTPYGMDAGPGPGFAGLLLLAVAAPVGVLLLLLWLTAGHASPGSIRLVFGLGLAVMVVTVIANTGIWPSKADHRPKDYYPPEQASAIVSFQRQSDFSYRLSLANGESADISHGGFYQGSPTPGPGALLPLGDMSDLRVGDLLIAGHEPGPWYMIAESRPGPAYPSGCYLLKVEAVFRSDHFELSVGVRLDPAEQFTISYRARESGSTTVDSLCLDGDGRVNYVP